MRNKQTFTPLEHLLRNFFASAIEPRTRLEFAYVTSLNNQFNRKETRRLASNSLHPYLSIGHATTKDNNETIRRQRADNGLNAAI